MEKKSNYTVIAVILLIIYIILISTWSKFSDNYIDFIFSFIHSFDITDFINKGYFG